MEMIDDIILQMIENRADIIIDSQKYSYDNAYVPRVTEVLSLINEDYLIRWANAIGLRHKNYDTELNRAATIGTFVHDFSDCIMRGENVDLSVVDRSIVNNVYNGITCFKNWWESLNKNYKVEIIFIEKELICKYFGGTCDVLLKINDKIYLGDFKTSNHIGYKYYMQLAAYRYILLVEHGINIDGTFILQLSKFNSIYKDYILDLHNNEHNMFLLNAFNTFSSTVMTYFNRLNTIQQYNKITFERGY